MNIAVALFCKSPQKSKPEDVPSSAICCILSSKTSKRQHTNVKKTIHLLLSLACQIIWPATSVSAENCDSSRCQIVKIGRTTLAIPRSYVGIGSSTVRQAGFLTFHWPDFNGAYDYDDRQADPKLWRNEIDVVVDNAERLPPLSEQLKAVIFLYKATKLVGQIYETDALHSVNSGYFTGTIYINRTKTQLNTFIRCLEIDRPAPSCEMFYRDGQLAMQIDFARPILPQWKYIRAEVSMRIHQFVSTNK